MKNMVFITVDPPYKSNKYPAILTQPEKVQELLQAFIQEQLVVRLGANQLLEASDNRVLVYFLTGCKKSLMFWFSLNGDVEPSELMKSRLASLSEVGEDGGPAQKIMEGLSIDALFQMMQALSVWGETRGFTRSTSQFKCTRGKQVSKSVVKGSVKQTYRFYEGHQADSHLVWDVSPSQVVTLKEDGISKKAWQIPSELYPLPNSLAPQVFTPENTEPFELEGMDELLGQYAYKMGHCYQNAEVIRQLLQLKYPSLQVELYAGWLCRLDRLVHHAWVVVNGKHVLDAGRLMSEQQLLVQTNEKERTGELPLYNQENLYRILAEQLKETKPFSQKYMCGKVLPETLYVGVPSELNEARQSFDTLIKKHPNHPAYPRMNQETRSNPTQDAISKYL